MSSKNVSNAAPLLGAFIALLGVVSTLEAAPITSPTPSPTPSPTVSPSPRVVLHPALDRRFSPSFPTPHTSVKDQGKVGFCWAYSGAGMLEAELLKQTGRETDLSEEYIGFFHLYDQVMKMAPTYFTDMEIRKPHVDKKGRTKGKLKAKVKNLLNGLMIHLFFHPSEGAPDLNLFNSIVTKYGIVPETVFSYKIQGENAEKGVEGRVLEFIQGTLRDPVKNKAFRKQNADGTYTSEPIAEKMLEELARVYTLESETAPKSGSACQSCNLLAAVNGFDQGGVRYTPQSFARSVLSFDENAYEQINVGPENHALVMDRIRRSVEQGNPVQIGMILFDGFREAVKGNGILMPETCGTYTACKPVGGHAILIVNNMTDPRNGSLSGVLIKNSWGQIGLDSMGSSRALPNKLGYQIVTPDYFSELYKIRMSDGSTPTWFVLLKR